MEKCVLYLVLERYNFLTLSTEEFSIYLRDRENDLYGRHINTGVQGTTIRILSLIIQMPFFPDPVTKNDASSIWDFVTASRFIFIIVCNYMILSGLVVILHR